MEQATNDGVPVQGCGGALSAHTDGDHRDAHYAQCGHAHSKDERTALDAVAFIIKAASASNGTATSNKDKQAKSNVHHSVDEEHLVKGRDEVHDWALFRLYWIGG